jgi:GT2 family glycosyltransferase/glycosyltransferase involved in cell wall biosynthesis
MSSDQSIDIIIPVYKNAALTKSCIDSVLSNIREIKQFSPRLLVINDSPDDHEVNSLLGKLTKTNPEVVIITNKVNSGFVRSVNSGLALSIKAGRDVILVNSDTETFPGTLANLVDAAYLDPQIGFICPRSNNASLCTLPHASFSAKQLTPKETYERWKEISTTLPKIHFTPTAIGFYMYIKHKVLANFGVLREEFGVGYEEENDLVMRANKAGYRAALANRSFAYHAGSASFNLLDLDLDTHRNSNLQKMTADHPEFLPLVRRYEWSPHYRAELLLSGLVGHKSGLVKLIIDLSATGPNHNGTNELAMGVIRSLAARQGHIFEISVLCSPEAFKFHEMETFGNIIRVDGNNPGKHAIAVRLGQPFDLHHINVLENLAPINIYGMLDTIAEDCGHLSITHNLSDHWQHVARHSNGLFFISQFSENTFCTRYPDANSIPKYTKLLPTRLKSYEVPQRDLPAQHVLILGNHFPHKASDATAAILTKAFPTIQFVVLGASTFDRGNLRGYRSGTLESETVATLYARASVVVLPSHVEGFGFGLMHALAARKPVVARNIEATAEILKTYESIEGVYLFNNDTEIQGALALAIQQTQSAIDDSAAHGWDEWADGLAELFKKTLSANDLFPRLCNRIYASDQLRKLVSLQNETNALSAGMNAANQSGSVRPAENLAALLQHVDAKFIECAYLTILNRPADPEGHMVYLTQLRNGTSKIKILDNLQSSAEGKNAKTKLEGLSEAVARYKKSRLPLIGAFFK